MDEVVAHSRAQIERGSKSFALAARLFDPPTRDSAVMLYAWCRHCDDVIDGQELGFATGAAGQGDRDALAGLVARTRAASAGRADDPVFAALARVVSRHDIPERFPLDLLEGFAMDVRGARYETLQDTLAYCYHVAGAVGVMMAMVMGARDPAVLRRASDLGIAFQLTNIARDVVEDARAQRVYLPGAWLADAGLPDDPAVLAHPEHRETLAAVVARLLDEAERYYRSARVGLAALPLRSAWAVATALDVYRQIGRTVRARGAHAWDGRAIVGKPRKMAAVALGLGGALSTRLASAADVPRDGLWTPPGL